MSCKSLKNIAIDDMNYRTLKELGHTGESFNDVLTDILNKVRRGNDVNRDRK